MKKPLCLRGFHGNKDLSALWWTLFGSCCRRCRCFYRTAEGSLRHVWCVWMWHITLFRFVRTFIYFIFNLIINNVVYSLFNNIKNILLLKNRKKLIVTSSDLVIRSLWEQRPSSGRSRNYKNSKGLEKQHKHYFLLAILVKVIVFDQSTTAWLYLILF